MIELFPEAKIDDFSRSILEDNGEGAHTYDHTRRVLQVCLEIGNTMGAKIRILGAAALLHDIGRPFEEQYGKSHSVISGELSKRFLEDIGYTDHEIEEVLSAIRTHRFSEGIEPISLEGRILSDADKLDAIGAIGVFRSIAQATVSGKGLRGFLEHADEKLLKLKDMLYTQEASRIAHDRHSLLERFVKQLRKEISASD
ncbi:MAG: HD domain-containing protein [Candidatus Thorarchaeota archaeon]